MKKSVIVNIHLIFWALLALFTFFVPAFITRILHPEEYQRFSSLMIVFAPVLFYAGYLGLAAIRLTRTGIVVALALCIAAAVSLYLSSALFTAYAAVAGIQLFIWAGTGVLFRFFIDWFRKRDELLLQGQESARSNLALLKSRVSPHFLFNTLHNIDALISCDKEKASDSLLKLADIMRYMLYDAQADRTSLVREVEFVEQYIALERLRLKNPAFVDYTFTGNPEGLIVAPMLLIPFVENAFKHSVDSGNEKGIVIRISLEKKRLHFFCENHFEDAEVQNDPDHGIGLKTVRQRLQLIYGSNHRLSLLSVYPVFTVQLEIPADEDPLHSH
jgi:hypothetical protein